MKDARPDGRFAVLDGMRGLAALVVIMDHVPSPALMALFPGRYLAVDFFFALSGFVLTHVYERRLASGMTLLAFMRARVVRLYPLYLLGTLAGAAVWFFSATLGLEAISRAHILLALLFGVFFLPCAPSLSPDPVSTYPLDGPAWSLFFELFVNVVFALVICRLGRALLIGLLAVSGVCLALAAAHYGKLDLGWSWDSFFGGFPRVIYEFLAGVLVYRLRDGWRAPAFPAWLPPLLLMALFMVRTPESMRWVYDALAGLFFFPLLVAVSASAEPRSVLLKACAAMGSLSYGVYVLHVPIWKGLDTALPFVLPAWQSLPGFIHYAIVAVLAIVAAAILNQAYDVPVRRWLSRQRASAIS